MNHREPANTQQRTYESQRPPIKYNHTPGLRIMFVPYFLSCCWSSNHPFLRAHVTWTKTRSNQCSSSGWPCRCRRTAKGRTSARLFCNSSLGVTGTCHVSLRQSWKRGNCRIWRFWDPGENSIEQGLRNAMGDNFTYGTSYPTPSAAAL